jgi:glycosyltransferase involved in cell wall biosynthesis
MQMTIILPSFNEPRAHETMRLCKELYPHAQVIISPDAGGQGKGWSIRKGVLASLGEIIVMIDADGDIHPRMIKRLLPFLDDFDIVVGSKAIGPLAFHRKIITLLSRIYIKFMFNLDVDTQTGIKAFRRHSVMKYICHDFAFDMELLARANKRGARMIEIPIDAKIQKSKSLGVLWKTLISSLKIWFRLSFLPE